MTRPNRRSITIRLLEVATACALVVVGGQAPSWAQDYPLTGGELNVSKSRITPGESLTVGGSGYVAGATVTISIGSTGRLLVTTTADPDGSFTASVTIPADLALGEHILESTGAGPDGSELTLRATVTVATPGSGQPITGSDVGPAVLVGTGLLLAGAVSIATVRRRRQVTA